METKFNTVYYGAFGSNLNKEQMKKRCPNAIPIDIATLKNYMLCFRSVADVIPFKGKNVPLGLYKITNKCEKSLDYYESFPKLYKGFIFHILD